MTEQLKKKVDSAIKLLQAYKDYELEVAYSGGKDSDVILELAKMAGINYRAIYKNTTIDPPGTIAHCKSKGCEIHKPTMTFMQCIEKAGFPSRFRRHCCDKLKEYKILDKSVPLLERLIELFTDVGDVVIDPCAGSGTTLLAAANLGRNAYGFEIKKNFYNDAKTKILPFVQRSIFAYTS